MEDLEIINTWLVKNKQYRAAVVQIYEKFEEKVRLFSELSPEKKIDLLNWDATMAISIRSLPATMSLHYRREFINILYATGIVAGKKIDRQNYGGVTLILNCKLIYKIFASVIERIRAGEPVSTEKYSPRMASLKRNTVDNNNDPPKSI